MFNITKKRKNDKTQKWVEYKDGAKFLITSSDDPAFNRFLELNQIQTEKELQGLSRVTKESSDIAKSRLFHAFAELIIDWSNVYASINGGEVEQLEYSVENAIMLCEMSNEAFDLISFIRKKADEILVEKHEMIEEEVGKSLSDTGGNLNTETYRTSKKTSTRSSKKKL